MTEDKEITPAILLQHIQKAAQDNTTRFNEMEKDMKDIKAEIHEMNQHFKSIDARLEHLEQDVFILIARKNAHAEQLERMEKVKLPKMQKSIRNLQKKFNNTRKSSSGRKIIATAKS